MADLNSGVARASLSERMAIEVSRASNWKLPTTGIPEISWLLRFRLAIGIEGVERDGNRFAKRSLQIIRQRWFRPLVCLSGRRRHCTRQNGTGPRSGQKTSRSNLSRPTTSLSNFCPTLAFQVTQFSHPVPDRPSTL